MTRWQGPTRQPLRLLLGAGREDGRPPRASSLILGATLAMLAVLLLAKVLTQLLTAI